VRVGWVAFAWICPSALDALQQRNVRRTGAAGAGQGNLLYYCEPSNGSVVFFMVLRLCGCPLSWL